MWYMKRGRKMSVNPPDGSAWEDMPGDGADEPPATAGSLTEQDATDFRYIRQLCLLAFSRIRRHPAWRTAIAGVYARALNSYESGGKRVRLPRGKLPLPDVQE